MNFRYIISTCILALFTISGYASTTAHTIEFLCNTKEEIQYLKTGNDSNILGSVSRYTDNGKSWDYEFDLSPGAACDVTVKAEGNGFIALYGESKLTTSVVLSDKKLNTYNLSAILPNNENKLILLIKSKKYIRLQSVKISWIDRDSDNNGLSDIIESMLGVSRTNPLQINNRPKEPHTSFQTPTSYLPENDIRTDSVIIYNPNKESYDSWKAHGYDTQTMYGFRVGDDYIKKFPEEGQTTANGTILTCGPGSYYMVPAKNRVDAALSYFKQAIESGSTAVIPEEPEFFQQAGYSGSFKKEWRDYYKEDWQDPASSIDSRWKSEQLKGYLEYRMVKSILDSSKKQKSDVKRMVAAHSQISYYSGGIIYPHYKVLMEPSFQELVGQVWTGTARAGNKYQGVFAERTFEWGYLEYSSLYNLMRDTGKGLWFLMDPLEDNPDRTMEDYQENYEKTLIGSLMFPEIDKFEVMPWPTRIYGRVPDWFSTKIGTIVNMLGDIHNQKTHEYMMGTQGIATFVSDSMAWQRGAPYPSDFTDFHGLTLPLLMQGVPIQVAQLERSVEPKYLNDYKVLFLNYDLLKPMSPDYNTALAKWVKDGGTLVIFGGSDAYNNLDEWWKSAGFNSPQEHLFKELGISATEPETLSLKNDFMPLISDNDHNHNNQNKKVYVIDISDRIVDNNAYIKFEDSNKDDGWGPLVSSIEIKIDGQTKYSFKPGTDEEKNYLADNNGSMFNGAARFADGNGYWIYKFKIQAGSKAELHVDMGNEFMLSTSRAAIDTEYKAIKTDDNLLTAKFPDMNIHASNIITAYKTDAKPLYKLGETEKSPFFEKSVGKGNVIYIGLAPRYFSTSKESADVMRAIAEYACSKSNVKYNETGYLGIRRGKYAAMRTFDNPYNFKGNYINMLDPQIQLLKDPLIPADNRCVLADVTDQYNDTQPRILISSDRIEAKTESAIKTSMLLTGPLKTKGVVRISTSGKEAKSIFAFDTKGQKVSIFYKEEDGTLFIRYDSQPDGVIIGVDWK